LNVIPPPKISLNSYYYDFGNIKRGDNSTINFEIWNSGGSNLNYNLLESCDWVDVFPEEGVSSGEKDNITVEIDTLPLELGEHEYDFSINSNGGNEIFSLIVNVVENEYDDISIIAPMRGNIYYKGRELKKSVFFKNRTLVVGPIFIEVSANSNYVDRVELVIDDTKVDLLDYPFIWKWDMDKIFGRVAIAARGYKNDFLVSDDETKVAFINLRSIRS